MSNIVNLKMMQTIAYKEILSFREALIYLDVSESFLYKQTSKNTISFFKPNGGKIYFKKEDLNNWMLQNDTLSKQDLKQEIENHLNQYFDSLYQHLLVKKDRPVTCNLQK